MPSTPNPVTPNWDLWNLSYVDDAYGPIYGGHSVQIAVVNTLKKWLPAYIADVNRHLGGDILPYLTPESFRPPTDRPWEADLDVQITCVVPGTTGTPKRSNETGIQSCWKADLDVFVYAGTDWQETLAITYAYGACARAAIVQHPALTGLAQTTNWLGESYFKGPDTGSRYSGIATINFEVNILNTVNQFAGPPSPEFAADGTPTDPSLLPLPAFPEVLDTSVDVDNLALNNKNGSPS